MTEAARHPVLELRGVSKRFGKVVAVDDVDFTLLPGEVHGLCGENGAGKSTLMNILYGLLQPTRGEVLIDGRPVRMKRPRNAIDHGIGMVHQHFMLIPEFSVAENIVLGDEPGQVGLLEMSAAVQRVRELSRQFGLVVDPTALVRDIGVGEQQRAEILKALYRHARVLILDEPTAVLTPQEIDELLRIIGELRSDGLSIILISHKLGEVLAIADRISVLRHGRIVATVTNEGQTEQSLAQMMVGRDVLLTVDRQPATPDRPVLRVHDLTVRNERGLEAVRSVGFEVRAGEIVAIAGIDGNGQSELVEAITGLREPAAGQVELDGRDITGLPPRAVSEAGVAHIPEDRHLRALVLDLDLRENAMLHDFANPAFVHHGIIDRDRAARHAAHLIESYDVRAGAGMTAPARSLSGGNQQKLVIARELERNPRLLVAAQPTRGVDIGAIEFIHRRLVEQRDSGAAVLLVSLELDEVLTLADRILVIRGGQIVAEFAGEVDDHELGLAMLGAGRAADDRGGPG